MARFDVLVVGAGPAGSVAALILARSGARVGLLDARSFPRDKACGDLVGPRGVGLLARLGALPPGARPVGDMRVVGPTGRSALLPALPGLTYPGFGLVVARARLDAHLRDAALAAGAEALHGRVAHLDGTSVGGVSARLAGGSRLDADLVVGADGARSTVAASAGLVGEALWAFAVRCYVAATVDLPTIVLWEPRRWQLFPGYGWVFPAADGAANLGLGAAVLQRRDGAGQAGRELDAFTAHLRRIGVLDAAPAHGPLTGGWLKLGGVGTTPARDGVLLAGDAAGLVNPLQGEGIAQAMASGEAAARAIIASGPSAAAVDYRAWLLTASRRSRRNASAHRVTVRHTSLVSAAGRVLTMPGMRIAMAGAWGLYWNELMEGAARTRHLAVALSLDWAVDRLADAAGRR